MQNELKQKINKILKGSFIVKEYTKRYKRREYCRSVGNKIEDKIKFELLDRCLDNVCCRETRLDKVSNKKIREIRNL